MSDSLWPHGLQHARRSCPSLSPRACSNSCPLSRRCHPTISSSIIPFSSCPQFFPYTGCCCQVTSVVSDSVRPHRWQPTRLPHPWDLQARTLEWRDPLNHTYLVWDLLLWKLLLSNRTLFSSLHPSGWLKESLDTSKYELLDHTLMTFLMAYFSSSGLIFFNGMFSACSFDIFWHSGISQINIC